jgi:hypothetical protein
MKPTKQTSSNPPPETALMRAHASDPFLPSLIVYTKEKNNILFRERTNTGRLVAYRSSGFQRSSSHSYHQISIHVLAETSHITGLYHNRHPSCTAQRHIHTLSIAYFPFFFCFLFVTKDRYMIQCFESRPRYYLKQPTNFHELRYGSHETRDYLICIFFLNFLRSIIIWRRYEFVWWKRHDAT